MAIQLVAGQIVADDFTLLHPIEDEGRKIIGCHAGLNPGARPT